MNKETDLNERLMQYEMTAKGQLTQGRSVGEIAGYAAAVGAGLAMAGSAEASIVYSGVQNISVSINPAAQASNNSFFQSASTTINIDGDSVGDLRLTAAFLGSASASFAKYYGGGLLQAMGGAAFLDAGGVAGAANLANSAMVGPGGLFFADAAGKIKLQAFYGGASSVLSYGNFASGATGFVGIQLASGNFGWIRLRLDDLGPNQPYSDLLGGAPQGDGQGYPDRVTVIDWAFDDAGAAIHVGDTRSVPEPSSLALLAAGAAGLAAFRRRKASRGR